MLGCQADTQSQAEIESQAETNHNSDDEDLSILSQLEIPSDDLTPEARASD
jgi:hypothetical protein